MTYVVRQRISRILIFLVYASCLTPLIVSGSTIFPFVFGKALYFQMLVEIMLFLWLLLLASDGELRSRLKTPLFYSLLFYAATLIITFFFSADLVRSFFSTHDRMTGLLFYLHFFVFAAIVGTVFSAKDAQNATWVSVGVSSLVALYGIGQKILDPALRVGSTLDNAMYLGAYAMVSIFLGIYGAMISTGWRRNVCLISLPLNAIVIFCTGSRGAVLFFFAAALMGACVTFFRIRSRRIRIAFVGFCIAISILAFFGLRGLYGAEGRQWAIQHLPESVQRVVYSLFSDSERIMLWDIGIKGFLERPLAGWGLGNYELIFQKHALDYAGKLRYENQIFDSSHSAIIDTIALTGMIGLAGMLVFVFVVFFVCWKLIKSRTASPSTRVGVLLGGFCASILLSLLSFHTPTSLLMLALVWGLIAHESQSVRRVESKKTRQHQGIPMIIRIGIGAVAFFLVVVLISVNIRPYFATLEMVKVYRVASTSDCSRLKDGFVNALSLSSILDTQLLGMLGLSVSAIAQQKHEIPACRDFIQFVMEKLESGQPTSPRAEYFDVLGSVYVIASRNNKLFAERGEKYVREAIRLIPYYSILHEHLARLLMEQSKNSEALGAITQAVNLERPNPRYLLTRASVYDALEERDLAAQDRKAAQQLSGAHK